MTTRISVSYPPTGQPEAAGVRVDLVSNGFAEGAGRRRHMATLQAGETVELDIEPGSYLAVGALPGAFPNNKDAVASHSDLPAQSPVTPPNVPDPPPARPAPPPAAAVAEKPSDDPNRIPTPPFDIPDAPEPVMFSDAPAAETPQERPVMRMAFKEALNNTPEPEPEQH